MEKARCSAKTLAIEVHLLLLQTDMAIETNTPSRTDDEYTKYSKRSHLQSVLRNLLYRSYQRIEEGRFAMMALSPNEPMGELLNQGLACIEKWMGKAKDALITNTGILEHMGGLISLNHYGDARLSVRKIEEANLAKAKQK